jgi:hypothetical protein
MTLGCRAGEGCRDRKASEARGRGLGQHQRRVISGPDRSCSRAKNVNKSTFLINHSAASLALLLFRGFPAAFFSTGAKNFPV